MSSLQLEPKPCHSEANAKTTYTTNNTNQKDNTKNDKGGSGYISTDHCHIVHFSVVNLGTMTNLLST